VSINTRIRPTDAQRKIKTFPGPYIGYVKNPTDVNRMGRLFVHIPDLHGDFEEATIQTQTVPVSYCSPFAGQTPLSATNNNREFNNTQKSYGFWMIPPDIDTKVLVMFANGDINSGYWLGCVYEDFMNHMTPGVAASGKFIGNAEQNKRYFEDLKYGDNENTDEDDPTALPVAEAQRRAESSNVSRLNTKPSVDNAYRYRPVHVPATETLINQGLITDTVRGTTSSSARRETPSQVFGISTPGPVDFEALTNSRDAINRHGKIYNNTFPFDEFDFRSVAQSRLGGQSFVMDDGTPAIAEIVAGKKAVGSISNELIRLRTRSGAQLLLHNSESLVYITNNDGTAWIEFTADGKIDIYSKDSVSVHTENDFNFRAERDINMEAGRNVNIKATGQNTTDNDINHLVNSDPTTTTGRVRIESSANYELVIGANGLIKAGTDIKTFAGNDFLVNTDTSNGGEIHFNTENTDLPGKEVLSTVLSNLETYDNAGVSATRDPNARESIMKRVPTAEPYAEHENKRKNKTTPTATDRELPEDRF